MTVDPSQEILFEVEGQIATITFNRPEAMNAMTWNMYDRLVGYCDELDQRDDIRVAIFEGGRRPGVRLGDRYQPVSGVFGSPGRDRLRTANRGGDRPAGAGAEADDRHDPWGLRRWWR